MSKVSAGVFVSIFSLIGVGIGTFAGGILSRFSVNRITFCAFFILIISVIVAAFSPCLSSFMTFNTESISSEPIRKSVQIHSTWIWDAAMTVIRQRGEFAASGALLSPPHKHKQQNSTAFSCLTKLGFATHTFITIPSSPKYLRVLQAPSPGSKTFSRNV